MVNLVLECKAYEKELIVLPGPVTAGKDKFTFTIHGQETHSAFPEREADSVNRTYTGVRLEQSRKPDFQLQHKK